MRALLIIVLIGLSSVDFYTPHSLKVKLHFLKDAGYRFPVGDSLGRGYYIAQKFQDPKMYEGTHLGIDISGIGKYNSDLGDTIYSINDGVVVDINEDKKEYIAVIHRYKDKHVKAIYLHCLKVFPNSGDLVRKGEPIALIGNSDGSYAAHLHLEIASDTTKWYGGYGWPEGYLDPETILPYYSKIK